MKECGRFGAKVRKAQPKAGTPQNRLCRAAGVAPGRGLAQRHEVREAWG